jgi:hypothetical protein
MKAKGKSNTPDGAISILNPAHKNTKLGRVSPNPDNGTLGGLPIRILDLKCGSSDNHKMIHLEAIVQSS